MKQQTRFRVFNFIALQLGWLVAVLYGNLAAFAFCLPLVAVHFYYSPCRRSDVLAVLLALALGLVHDGLLLGVDYIAFVDSRWGPPWWLMSLWLLLGLAVNHSLSWVYQRPLLAGALGAVVGPLSYIAGERLSSAYWQVDLAYILPLLTVLWALVLPLHRYMLLWLSRRLYSPSR